MKSTLYTRYPALEVCREDLDAVIDRLIEIYEAGGKLLICGNGGSAADSSHIVGELMKGFLKKRPISDEDKKVMKDASPTLSDDTLSKLQVGLPAIALPEFSAALSSAFANDVDPDLQYAQAVLGLGKINDMLICISTSGNAKNCVAAAQVANAIGMTTVALTGATGGKLKTICDITIAVPATETYQVQEYHLPVYHELCARVEAHFFAE
ncbi:MAG: SIS domain-containing protein [Ruminococcaceae bacterium]|nr:SIS domain-containing protein [Oscillospiraceae bacterium]